MVEAATLAREEISSVVIKIYIEIPHHYRCDETNVQYRKENYMCSRINEKIMKLCGVCSFSSSSSVASYVARLE